MEVWKGNRKGESEEIVFLHTFASEENSGQTQGIVEFGESR